ncbi:putative inorganic carbon transporter subunit DabA [Amnibacterium sp.]|uniref:putative inorganic carbon transporter subunit DabA n=1 Tax=Amnibacterium sp. TaxID=1872496 RepID=UPI003F7C6EAC
MTTAHPLDVRARIGRAAHALTPTWPLESFIAVNPMGAHTHRPVEQLVAESLVGGPAMTRAESDYRNALQAGSLDRQAIEQAIRRVVPELLAIPAVSRTGGDVSALDIAVAHLLEAEAATPRSIPRAFSAVDDLTSSWLSVLLGDAPWAPRDADQPAFSAFLRLATRDRRLSAAGRRRLAALPPDPEAAITAVLDGIGLPLEAADPVLQAQIHALPGWSSLIAQRSEATRGITLTDVVAIRLALLAALGIVPEAEPAPLEAPSEDLRRITTRLSTSLRLAASARGTVLRVAALLDPATRLLLWQTATEITYRDQLFRTLADATHRAGAAPGVQVVCCIDARSEGLRRLLERDADVETFGFAGFFGVPLRYRPLAGSADRAQYPALLTDGAPATEAPVHEAERRRHVDALSTSAATASGVKAASATPAAALSWAEAAGAVSADAATARTVAPATAARLSAAVRSRTVRPLQTVLDLGDRLGPEDRIRLAEASLRMMGMTRFAPLVVFTAHRSETANNLYRSALDCGACGGNGGAPNARAAAAVLNDPEVRAGLERRGITVPGSTWFIAAEHETTTDAITVLDPHLIPPTHRAAIDRFARMAQAAGDALTRERALQLPGADARTPLGSVRRRARDWAEMYPELGLAGNAAMLIAPRSVSRGADLGRRVFLHSYEPEADPDGGALEAIMTAPLIVAQWINAQYYCSTVEPERHGAGHKSLHNPVGALGVLTGSTGDLRTGLPWQSVAAGDRLLHVPLRLSVLIQAPLDRVATIVARTDVLRDLLANDWITLHARAGAQDPWQEYGTYGFSTPERTDA